MLLVLYNSRFICFNLIMYLSSITISFIFYIFSKEEFLMSLFFSDFIHTRTDLTQKISDIQQQLNQLPHGKLIISHNGENIKWYSSDSHSKKYIPKSDRALAEQLALRKYLTSLLEELLQEKKAINFYDRHRPKAIKSSILLQDASLGYSELLASYFQLSPSHTAWMQETYDHNSKNPENLIYKAVNGISVRSKSEAIIAMLLYTNKIPFRYECALNLGDIKFYPDFTILHPKTEQLYYWEHFGLMDSPGYCQNAFSKQQLYAAHGILPSVHLLTTYENQAYPLNTELVEKMIYYYFLR